MPSCPRGTILYTVRPGDTLWLIANRYHTNIFAVSEDNPGVDMNHLNVGQVIRICPENGGYQQARLQSAEIGVTSIELALSNAMRMLWEQHAMWTRMAIMSLVFDLPDGEVVTQRLLQNPKDFAALLEPFYGDQIATKFSDLLSEHLVIASDLVKAAKAGDTASASAAETKWYANADEIAAFLASINPYWSEDNWKNMLYEHLGLVKQEATDMLTGKYAESIATYDMIEMQALAMADMMTYGIVRQFQSLF